MDNRCVLDALVAACAAGGVSIVEDEVDAVEIDTAEGGGAVAGVTLGHGGSRPAGAVVLAAGCRSGQLGGIPDRLLPPVRPVKGLTLRLRAPAGSRRLARTVRGLVHGRSCYLVPRRDGTVVVGATVEEKGFDLAVQVGAVGDLLDDARRLVPSLEEYELVDTTAGLRPGSPDNAPIVGTTDVRGLVVATGHYRNGFLLAPVTADGVVGILSGERTVGCRDGAGPAGGTVPSGCSHPSARTGSRRREPSRPARRPARRVQAGPVSTASVNGTAWEVPAGTTVADWSRPGAPRHGASPWRATATWSRRAGGRTPRWPTATGSRSSRRRPAGSGG